MKLPHNPPRQTTLKLPQAGKSAVKLVSPKVKTPESFDRWLDRMETQRGKRRRGGYGQDLGRIGMTGE